MKSSKIISCALAALAVCACTDKASVKGCIADAPSATLVVKQLDINTYSVIDTVKTDASGNFTCNVEVAKGQPEFVYIFKGDTRLAGMLLEKGDKVTVKADTLGNYSVEGSEASAKLAENEKRFSDFMNAMYASEEDPAKLTKLYLEYYRGSVKYALDNCFSLTAVPVLFETVNEGFPVFNHSTDALIFRNVTDSLKTVYPDSKYVRALEKETRNREKQMKLASQITDAQETSFPEINLPDSKGARRSLSGVDAKVILLHFWTVSDPVQKMFNLDVLLPLYNDYSARGLEIYSVCLTRDKADWGATVTSQKLPWINVCDTVGSSALFYNVQSVPVSVIIANGEIGNSNITDEKALRREIDRLLRR